jgi:integrase/recombinase XerD
MPRISAGTAFRRYTLRMRAHKKEAFERIVPGKEPEKLPPVLNREEIARFLEAVAGLRNRVALVVRLKISSIDSKGMLIHIESAKGGKDRCAMLPPQLLHVLHSNSPDTRTPLPPE